MQGLNATTGRAIAGLAHLYQSIYKILTTPIGSRVARREFGSDVFTLTDAPNNPATRVRLYAAVATALIRWEPRLTLTRVQLVTSTVDTYAGAAVVDIEGTTTEGQSVSTSVPLTPGTSV
jgi:phage baseplate assembly protein W